MTTSVQQRGFDLSSLRCAAGTDVGMRREENQDSFGVVRHPAFQGFFVADGMGGVKGGAIASRLAISILEQELPSLTGADLTPASLSALVATINSRIFEQGAAQPELAGMGTTLVGLMFTQEGILLVNVGDSRAYRIRGDSISQISEDHTLVRELVRSGAISSKEADHHPVSHMLTRSLGPLAEVVVECRLESENPQEGDIYVLCSDGLYNFVKDHEILDVVRQNPLDDANQILINLANRRGGTDNITVIVVSVGEGGGRRRGHDYRKAWGEPSGAVSAHADTDAKDRNPRSHITEARDSTVPSGAEVAQTVAPRVEEPKDYHAERESLKERKRRIYQQSQGVPVTLMLGAAVIFGLVVGDVARRWGAFPDFLSLGESGPWSFNSREREPEMVTNFEDLTKELALTRSQSRNREGLPEIARRVGGIDSASARSRDGMVHHNGASLNRTTLESAATKIEAQLTMLSESSRDAAAASLQRAQSQRDRFAVELKEIEGQIDIASRKLSLWFGRKKKAEAGGEELFQLGGDMERVGAVSERVKRKAAEWTEATYRLQAKQDEFELYPSNNELRKEVEKLAEDRARLQAKLGEEVVLAIDSVLADTYRQLEDLKARRDIVAAQANNALEEVEFIQTVASPDEAARTALRKRLEGELADIREALAGMKG
jgi:serine/threonine protein phosphatase PrpC